MVEPLTQRNKEEFKVFVKNKEGHQMSFIYTLQDNPIAELWYKSMKHLRNVECHGIDSLRQEPRDIKTCYVEFCKFAQIEPLEFDHIDQSVLNIFHEQFMHHNDVLSRKKNNDILYEFHQSIHSMERQNSGISRHDDMHRVCYSRFSAPFHKKFPCNLYYADQVVKDNLYLLIADSGKRPLECWSDGEANDENNIDKTMIAHYTFKPDWFISLQSKQPRPLSDKFYEWFEKHKATFLKKYGLNKWDEIDETTSVLLARPKTPSHISDYIKKGYSFNTLEISSGHFSTNK